MRRQTVKKVAIVIMIMVVIGLFFGTYRLGYNAGYGQAKYDYISKKAWSEELQFQTGYITGYKAAENN